MALSEDRNTLMKDGELIAVPVAAGARIYAGSLVVANPSGYAAPGSAVSGLTYLGRAEERVDNSSGGDGDQKVLVRRKKDFRWANSTSDPVTQADLGKVCYIEDDQTVSRSDDGASRSPAGTVVGFDSDGVWVGDGLLGHAHALDGSGELDFGSIAGGDNAVKTLTVAGAALGDGVVLGLPSTADAGLIFQAFVSAANTVTIRAENHTEAAIDPASATYRVKVLKG